MGALRDVVYRFAVRGPDGARSAVWRLWTHTPAKTGKQTEIYLAVRNVAGDFKASLHASGRWRIGFSRDDHPQIPPGQDRAVAKWRRPAELTPGWTRAFQIGIPARDVVIPRAAAPTKERHINWFPKAGPGMGTFFDVFIASAAVNLNEGWPGRDAMGTTLIFDALLGTGERLCVLLHEEPFDDSHVPRAAIAEPDSDDRDDGDADIRSQVLALIDDGTWAFIDIAVDPPPDDH